MHCLSASTSCCRREWDGTEHVSARYHAPALPQVNQAGNMLTATWMFDDPRTAQTEARRQTMGAFLVLPSLKWVSVVGQLASAHTLRASC